MYSTKRTEGSCCGENTAPGLWSQGQRLSLLSYEVSYYHLTEGSTCLILPDASSVYHRTSSHIAEHCRVPTWWLVRQECVNTALQHPDSIETHDPVTQQAW